MNTESRCISRRTDPTIVGGLDARAPVGKVQIPSKYADLLTKPDVYAVCCRGDCMEPEVAEGDVLLVDPHSTPRSGDLVALFVKQGGVEGGLVKRLVFHSTGEGNSNVAGTAVEQINPRRLYSFMPEDVRAVHKIIATVPSDNVRGPEGGAS